MELVITGLLIVLLVLILILLLKISKADSTDYKPYFDNITNSLIKTEQSIRDEISRFREELNNQSKNQREELNSAVSSFGNSVSARISDSTNFQKVQFDDFEERINKLTSENNQNLKDAQVRSEKLYNEFRANIAEILKDISGMAEKISKDVDAKLSDVLNGLVKFSKDSREELSLSLKSFDESSTRNFNELINANKERLNALQNDQKEFNSIIEIRLDKIRNVVEEKLQSMQEDNAKKLEEMRKTVDDKLHTTLETRLTQSFKLVSERLEQVQVGLGEMQSLATGVGDLKKVLTNVKARGMLGEYQLESLLEQVLSPEQYSINVQTNPESRDMVEFAVKLPGKEDHGKFVWLPIDSKFPIEDYTALVNAYEGGDIKLIEDLKKSLVNVIRKCAKDIRSKYIFPPNTTDFGIMFLPFESLYAEVLRNPGLFESIQKEFKVTIAGPTTLAAFLNSLQMGFRTLAIEKRSSEVWDLLGAVKSEFGVFGEILTKTQKKLQEASNVIDQAGTRSRAIERKLRDVQMLPKADASNLLGEEFQESDTNFKKYEQED